MLALWCFYDAHSLNLKSQAIVWPFGMVYDYSEKEKHGFSPSHIEYQMLGLLNTNLFKFITQIVREVPEKVSQAFSKVYIMQIISNYRQMCHYVLSILFGTFIWFKHSSHVLS